MIPGAGLTVRVKAWVAAAPFVAVIENLYVLPEPAAGVPASVVCADRLRVPARGSAPVWDNPHGVGTLSALTKMVWAGPT